MAGSSSSDIPITREEFQGLKDQLAKMMALMEKQTNDVEKDKGKDKEKEKLNEDEESETGQNKKDKRKTIEIPDDTEGVELTKKMQSLEEAMKAMKGTTSHGGVSYEDLCLVPSVKYPEKFKVPDFEKYSGEGDPYLHLKYYISDLGKYAQDENLRVQLFQKSLSGAARNWFSRLDKKQVCSWEDVAQAFMKQYGFHSQMAPDMFQLMKVKKTPNESFKDYAQKWRALAAQIEPPMTEKTMVKMFIETQEQPYYEWVLKAEDRDFAEVVKQGMRFEEGVKSGKLSDPTAIRAAAEQIQSGTYQKKLPKKKEADVSLILPGPGVQKTQNVAVQAPNFNNNYRTEAPARGRQYEKREFRTFTPLGEPLEEVLKILLAQKKVTLRPPPNHDPNSKNYDPSQRCTFHSSAPGHSTENCYALKHKVQDLIDAKEIVVAPENTPNVDVNPLPKHDARVNMIDFGDEGIMYKYMYPKQSGEGTVGVVGEESVVISIKGKSTLDETTKATEPKSAVIMIKGKSLSEGKIDAIVIKAPQPIVIKKIVQDPVKSLKEVPWKYGNGQSNSEDEGLIANTQQTVGFKWTREVRSQTKPKVEISDQEVKEFLKKMKHPEASVLKSMEEAPKKISMFDLVMNSESHRGKLIEMLAEAYIDKNISEERFEDLLNCMVANNVITFSDDEIPSEGRGHRKPLHITVQCSGYVVGGVLIDGGSALNICPYETLTKMGIDRNRVRSSSTVVRAFDGTRRDTVGEIELAVDIGPHAFNIIFQILDIKSGYNMLLGRPWIHTAGAVPSTLHQQVKYVINQELVTLWGEKGLKKEDVPYVGVNSEVDHSSYQTLEISSASYHLGQPSNKGYISEEVNAMAKEMIKSGFVIGKGLGKDLQGSSNPIVIPQQKTKAGLGYQGKPRKEYPGGKMIIPPIESSFIRGGSTADEENVLLKGKDVEEEPAEIKQENGVLASFSHIDWSTVDVSDYLGLLKLDEVSVIITDEGGSNDDYQIIPAQPGMLNNWIVEPMPHKREFRYI